MKYDIITVGSNVVDVFVKTDAEESDLITIRHGKQGNPVEELVAYPLGSKILIKHIDFQIGGGGTNTAVAFSRLGLKTGYIGKIGKDENGLKVFKMLKKEHITFLGTLGEVNGYSIILDSVGEDRTILTYKGCNDHLTYSEIEKRDLKTKAFYLCSMMGESLHVLEEIARLGQQQKSLVAFNPSSYLTRKGLKHIQTILDNTDVLILNDEEARQLAGYGTIPDLAHRLSKQGPTTVAITQGSKGVLVYHQEKIYQAQAKKNIVIHETTGAGDAFGSSFVAGIVIKKTLPQAIKMGLINAESVISHYGAKNILLTQQVMNNKLTQDKRLIHSNKG